MSKMHPARVYVLYNFLMSLGQALIATTYVPWLLHVGLSMGEVALVNAFFFGTITLAELPTGMLADGRSRTWSVRLGLAILAVSFFTYALARGFWSAVFSEVLCGLAAAFMSGADQAWLTDALKARGEKDGVGRALGTSAAWNSAAFLAGGFAGTWIALPHRFLPWIMGGLLQLAALAVCWRWMKGQGEPPQRVGETEAFRRSWRALRGDRLLRWAAIAGMAYGLVLPFNYYWTPLFEQRAGQSALSWIWVAVYGALLLAGWAVRGRASWRGLEPHGIAVALLLAGLGLAGAGLASGLLVPIALAAVHEFGRGTFQPLLSALTQRRVDSEYRATYGSCQSLISRGGYAVVVFAIWFALGDAKPTMATIGWTWAASGCLLAIAAIALWLARSPVQTVPPDRT